MPLNTDPHREPLQSVVTRNLAIAAAVATIAAFATGRLSRWPLVFLLALWPSFGGHWIELWFLHYLRPRLPAHRPIHTTARILLWFAAGALFTFAMRATLALVSKLAAPMPPTRLPSWWAGGLAFLTLELLVHAALTSRRRPSFFNHRG